MTDLRDYQKKAIAAALEDHISAGRIHPRWRNMLSAADENPDWAKSLRAKLDDADRAKARQASEIIVDEAQKLRAAAKAPHYYDCHIQPLGRDVRAAFASRLGREVKPPEAKTRVEYDPEQMTLPIDGHRIPGVFSVSFPTVTLPGRVERIETKVSISLGEPRCECGSGNHSRGPGHSDYCKLWEKS